MDTVSQLDALGHDCDKLGMSIEDWPGDGVFKLIFLIFLHGIETAFTSEYY